MTVRRLRLVLTIAALLTGLASCAGAEVTGYYAKTTLRGEMELLGVTVVRGDGAVTFDAARLIGVRPTHFKSNDASNLAVVAGSPPPARGQRHLLLRDNKLNTGLLNPGGQASSLSADPVLEGPHATPGLAIEFDEPVVNLPGDDVVVFELHRELNSPLGGDAFHAGPLRFKPGLRSVTVRAFDVRCDDPRALPLAGFDLYRLAAAAGSIDDLQSAAVSKTTSAPLDDFKILAVGIDLSDLGYLLGEAANGLFIQDDGGTGLQVDPVLIAGLPARVPANLMQEIPEDAMSGPKPGEMLDAMLEGPMAGVEEIVFAERICGFDHWYANFGYYAAGVAEYPPQRGVEGEEIPPCFGEGGRLCRFHLRTRERTVLLDDPTGGVRDPQVHYDAKKILFSYRKGDEPYYHLYEINVDGSGLVQLTDGPHDDVEPAYLPDGNIVFCSSRCNRYVNCHRTPVATLYRCDADGGNVRMLSTNIEHDNTPWVLPDGRVIYMRWEYVDRSQFCFHHLWTTNPDGTGQMVYFGNQFPDTAMLDAKPIPGTKKVVASFSPGHGRPGHMGYVTIVDPSAGPDNRASARRISQGGRYFRDPYPFSEDCFLVADDAGIYVMDGQGNTDLIYKAPPGERGLTCHEPRTLLPRPREPVVPSRTDLSRSTGRLLLGDVYTGRNMAGVRRGEIKKLLILEQLPKPINFSGGMWPISAGGTFTLARILGTVPVDSDGSAYFEVPAKDDLSVKRMQSFLSVEPGETAGCVGCHEPRMEPPQIGLAQTAYLRRPPSRIEPIDDVPDVIDFPRDVQPILDEHCLGCHNPDCMEGGVDLCGDHTPLFCTSYWTLLERALISDGRNERYGNRPPRSIGSSASRLLDLIDGTHCDARLTDRQRRTLRLWIDSSAVYAGTYAALASGMHPVEFPIDVMERRCGGCHGVEPTGKRIGTGMYFRFGESGPALPLVHEFLDLQQIRGSIGYYKLGSARPPQSLCNLSRPDKSPLLQAPLSLDSGGLGLCKPAVFVSVDDPDYRQILARIVTASERHNAERRFDMPGFRPNVYYLKKMQTYGILSRELSLDEPIDVYATDRAYWRSFWHDVSRPSR
ncbi:MAG: HzsA-related protein [Planctomycetota bacterium]